MSYDGTVKELTIGSGLYEIKDAEARSDISDLSSDIASLALDISALANLSNASFKTALLNFFYPVGSYYETSNASFNPNTSFGGTWSLETEGKVHIGSGSTYAVGATGGATTVTLTAAQCGVPAHGHSNTFILSGNTGLVYSTDAVGATRGLPSSSSSSNYSTIYKKFNSSGTAGLRTVSLSGGVSNNSAANASQAHNNMQPYIVVKRWHRTA